MKPTIIKGVTIALALNIPCKPITEPMKTAIKNKMETYRAKKKKD